MWRTLLCLLGLISGQQEVVFRTSVELIPVDVQVLDGDKTVLGLKRAEFIVFEDGFAQPIVQFETEQQGVDLLLALCISSCVRKTLTSLKQQSVLNQTTEFACNPSDFAYQHRLAKRETTL